MVEIKLGPLTVDLPYMIRISDVTEAMFDELMDEDTKAELIDGVMIVHSPASIGHDDLAAFVRTLLRMYTSTKELGRVLGPDCLIVPARSRQFAPDWFFLSNRQIPRKFGKKYRGVPDMVGEVLSPSNRGYDLDEKRRYYQEAGIPEIWLIDPEEHQVIIDRRRARTYLTTTVSNGRVSSDVLQGFWLEADWLWTEPLPSEAICLKKILRTAGE